MRNTWLIIKREFLERVRGRAFVIFTFLTPALMFAMIVLPSKLMMMKSSGTRHVAILSSDHAFAQEVQTILSTPRDSKPAAGEDAPQSYELEIVSSNDDATRARLNDEISAKRLDGYVWLADNVVTQRKFTYVTRNASDFIDVETVRSAVRTAIGRTELRAAGVNDTVLEALSKPVQVETLRMDNGKMSKSGGLAALLFPFVLLMMIYMTVLIYGMSVMRSIIQEKSSRVVEVLLSSMTAKELMMGKLIGVGAVGLAQLLIWSVLGLVAGTPMLMAVKSMIRDVQIPVAGLIAFPIFFVLGYLLYSAMFAALGAMVNSEEEAQQMQFPVMMPLILCTVFAMAIIRQPNSQMALWLSMIPLTAPIIMFVRIVVQTPPAWQIALSVGLMIATIYVVMAVCARIYRVGILMYGKRPTLPEILKWVRYA